MIMAVKFDSVADLINKFNESGNHFFDRETLRFWDSRVHNELYGGRVFVTSERESDERERRYTVRIATREENGAYSVESLSFRAYGDRDEAHHAAAVVGGLNDYGFIPDAFEHGQNVALGRFLGIFDDYESDDGGWDFGKPSGFSRRR